MTCYHTVPCETDQVTSQTVEDNTKYVWLSSLSHIFTLNVFNNVLTKRNLYLF